MIQKSESEIMKNWSKSDTPIVSISCTAYNHEKYIEEALDSFLMQETTFPFEVIVHDDASTDKTADIIRRYENSYPTIIKPIYEKTNLYSKNYESLRSIINSACNGKYIALCEGDDHWISKEKLEKQVQYMESHPDCSLCTHNTVFHYTDGSQEDRLFNEWPDIHILSEREVFFGWNVHTSSYLFRKEHFELPAFSSICKYGDYVRLTVAFYLGYICALPDVMSFYNGKREAGITNIMSKKGMEDKLGRKNYLLEYDRFTKYEYTKTISERIEQIELENSFYEFDKALMNSEWFKLENISKAIYRNGYYKTFLKSLCLGMYIKVRIKYEAARFGVVYAYKLLKK